MILLQGKKLGMTHIFTEDGKRCAVTVVETNFSDKNNENKDSFQSGDFVDVTAISKGKGFQGGMKRWHWSGTPQTHGSMSHRRVGSIGSSAAPSRVFKGKTMPGHMGSTTVTIQNLKLIKLDVENNLVVIQGGVPGHRNSRLTIKKAKKKSNTIQQNQPEKQEK